MEHLLHFRHGEETQLLQLAGLSLIDEAGRMERCAAKRAAVVALQGEGAVRNQMAAGQGSALKASLLAKHVSQEGEKMIGPCLTRGYVPAFHQWCPVEVDAHHIVDACGNVCQLFNGNGSQCTQQFFADAVTCLSQSGDESHDGH